MKVIQEIRVIEHNVMLVLLVSGLFLLTGCSKHATAPSQAVLVPGPAVILPDYADVTIPPNIAPLNFSVQGDSVTSCVAQISFDGGSYIYGEGRKVVIDDDEWREVLRKSVGKS